MSSIQNIQAIGQVRFSNFTNEVEAALNRQINGELQAFYTYQAMASWCGRDDVALHGLRDLCLTEANNELLDARGLIDYVTRKGGNVIYYDIVSPYTTGNPPWNSPIQLMEYMLEMEKKNYSMLLAIHQAATATRDSEMEDFLQQHYLKPQTKDIKRIADIITNLKRCGIEGCGTFVWDRELQKSYPHSSYLSPYYGRSLEDVLPRPFKN